MIGEPLRDALTDLLGGEPVIRRGVGGGSIARAFELELAGRRMFLKTGGPAVAATFPGEAAGLEALRAAASPLRIPRVLGRAAAGDHDAGGFLLLEWLEPGPRPPDFWDRLARGLAALHHHESRAPDGRPRYGFARDNHIGRTPQANGWMRAWPAFFAERRLAPQVARARAAGLWSRGWDRPLARLLSALPRELPRAPCPSLVHGDLWSGNVLCARGGAPALFDPAAYYGHREVDLAMSELFGGFAPRFYDAYREAWPLEPGYPRRRAIYNLYHAINHLNLFGADAYVGMVTRHLTALA